MVMVSIRGRGNFCNYCGLLLTNNSEKLTGALLLDNSRRQTGLINRRNRPSTLPNSSCTSDCQTLISTFSKVISNLNYLAVAFLQLFSLFSEFALCFLPAFSHDRSRCDPVAAFHVAIQKPQRLKNSRKKLKSLYIKK